MILSFLTFMYGFVCVFVIFMVLLQKGKGSLGLGNIGGGNQMLFGSSGGQNIFEKITWICCVILLFGSLTLSILRGKHRGTKSSYKVPVQQTMPSSEEAE